MKRSIDVVRMQSVSWPATVGWPLGILALSFGANLAIFGLIGDAAPPEDRFTGGVASIYLVMLIGYLQSMTQFFPFALGLSVTRREFWNGTALLVALQAFGFGALLVALLAVERATGGWGIELEFFGLGFMEQSNVLTQWLAYSVPFLALSAMGVLVGVVLKRWGATGMYVQAVGSALLLVGAILALTWRSWWDDLGRFFTDQSTLALLVGYPFAIAVLLAAASFLTIRRATP